jgi:dihydrofolate reductase
MTEFPECHAFIASSLDGYIARSDGDIDWLTSIPVADGEDGGYAAFIAGMDGILMGRGTWDKVRTFSPWPYTLPVTVLSRSLPAGPLGPVQVDGRPLEEVLATLAAAGHKRIYVDGGQVISSCLRAGLLTRLTVTVAPVLIGQGLPLFCDTRMVRLSLVGTRSWAPGFVQMVYAPDNSRAD